MKQVINEFRCYQERVLRILHVLFRKLVLYSDDADFVMRVDCMTRYEYGIWLTYAVISSLRSLARYESRAYLSPLASNPLLVPSRLAFLQRSASGTVCLRPS